MTAAELAKLVEGMELPEGLTFIQGHDVPSWWWVEGAPIKNSIAVLILEAWAARKLDEKFHGDWYCDGYRDDWKVWKVGAVEREERWHGTGPTKLAALLSALRAMDKENKRED